MLHTRGNKITWLGHAAFRIDTASGKVILVDPGFSPTRSVRRRIRNSSVWTPCLSRTAISTTSPTPWNWERISNRKWWEFMNCALGWKSKGVQNINPMNKGGTQKVGEIEVTMVNAVHSCGILDGDHIVYGGEACGYVLRLPGGLTVYHAGDTALFGDMKLIAELYAPDVALLPIGDHFTMGPREAAMAIRFLNVRHVIPMHFGTFPVLVGRPEQVRQLTQDISGLEIHVLKPGESIGEASSHFAAQR